MEMASDDAKVVLDSLRRIEQMVTVLARASVSERLEEILNDPSTRLVYQGAGKISRPELERRTGFSGGKISNLWKQWEMHGLMVKSGKSYEALF
jgi:hypothetical protein